ncbi:MAG: YiiX/YebB-like N1pC/P60 family cysteine hydrolase, partial [Planctomycetota bacterium]
LSESTAELIPLVEVSHATQEEILAFRERYDRLHRDAPLPPRSLRKLRDGRRRYLNLQDRLVDLTKRFAPWAAPGGAADIDPALRFQGLSVSLIAASTIYDNYLSLLTILKDDSLRRLLNHADLGYGIEEDAIWKIVEELNSTAARGNLHQLVEAWTEADRTLALTDETSVRLRAAVESSVSYRHARDLSVAEHLPSEWAIRRHRFLDALDGLATDALGKISEVFGNGIGLVETRKGKLWNDEQVRERLLGMLQPLDVLLEKTPFRLTDFFIPGHFGHVAIWMGSDPELDASGVFARPEMQKEPLSGYRAQIRTGHSVLEALRTGVELNTLEHFLNVDDVAILRPKALSNDEVLESLVRGFRQIGKEYDFNFDVETTGSIVCSELPYHVYPGVRWKTETQLGRFTISPDDIASLALGDDAAFELIVLYHDGRPIDADTDLARMEALMRDG